MTAVELLLSKLPAARPNGKGWSCRCPAHDDQNPSLSVSEGDGGRAVIHCHAGCAPEAIVAALGLQLADLMPAEDVNGNETLRRSAITGVSSTRQGRPPSKTYGTVNEAVADLERRHGPRSALWTYHDVKGEPVGVVIRWDQSEGRKKFRPVSRNGEEWGIGGMRAPLSSGGTEPATAGQN